MTIDRADTFDTMGWAGLCDLVHVALLQGQCSPAGATQNITVTLSANSSAFIDSIQGPLRCGAATAATVGATGPVLRLASTTLSALVDVYAQIARLGDVIASLAPAA